MDDEFVVGEDEGEEVGAPRFSPLFLRRFGPAWRRRIKRPPLPVRPALRAGPAAGAPDVGIALGLGNRTFAPGQTTAQLEATVQESFRIEDLIVDIRYAATWNGGVMMVSNVRVGTRSLFAGTEPMPASAFAATAQLRPQLGRGLVVPAGKMITVDFTLTTASTVGTCDVIATIVGAAR